MNCSGWFELFFVVVNYLIFCLVLFFTVLLANVNPLFPFLRTGKFFFTIIISDNYHPLYFCILSWRRTCFYLVLVNAFPSVDFLDQSWYSVCNYPTEILICIVIIIIYTLNLLLFFPNLWKVTEYKPLLLNSYFVLLFLCFSLSPKIWHLGPSCIYRQLLFAGSLGVINICF